MGASSRNARSVRDGPEALADAAQPELPVRASLRRGCGAAAELTLDNGATKTPHGELSVTSRAVNASREPSTRLALDLLI